MDWLKLLMGALGGGGENPADAMEPTLGGAMAPGKMPTPGNVAPGVNYTPPAGGMPSIAPVTSVTSNATGPDAASTSTPFDTKNAGIWAKLVGAGLGTGGGGGAPQMPHPVVAGAPQAAPMQAGALPTMQPLKPVASSTNAINPNILAMLMGQHA